jgi:hypothetical protein
MKALALFALSAGCPGLQRIDVARRQMGSDEGFHALSS